MQGALIFNEPCVIVSKDGQKTSGQLVRLDGLVAFSQRPKSIVCLLSNPKKGISGLIALDPSAGPFSRTSFPDIWPVQRLGMYFPAKNFTETGCLKLTVKKNEQGLALVVTRRLKLI